ncbi:MAG: hypothetical protein BZY88_09130 [SAR202 cluster bacterium Io17-Chloro-G9]|nr:MAG: hypothetical protein BZY88_09130 [SAR202 cluster bacterium Io17-Chloro-G9]
MSANRNHAPLPPFIKPSSQRSRNMSAIRCKDTAPELTVRKSLHAAGFRFRLRPKKLPGRADVVLPRYRHVVFVNGCFWHGHSCKAGHVPKTNSDYWAAKIERNKRRDRQNSNILRGDGWSVTELWECNLDGGLKKLIVKLDAQRTREFTRP